MDRGAYILGCSGLRLTPDERAFLADARPLGFILFARNVAGPAQLRQLVDELRAAGGADAPVLVDQEGGRVQRLGPPHWQAWPPPLDFVRQSGAAAERAAWLRYRLIAAELHEVGIDVNCAPCADVASARTHPFLRNRCFGSDPSAVAAIARAAARGLMDGGVLPVVKHLPGHGAASADSHSELPVVPASLQELRARDFAAFRPLGDLPMAMTAHVLFPRIDAERPATLSPDLIGLIRRDIGFSGLLMSDDISMGALGGSLRSRVGTALDAGCDLVLHCNGKLAEMEQVADAAGRLRPGAARRAAGALARRGAPSEFDRFEARRELAAICGEDQDVG